MTEDIEKLLREGNVVKASEAIQKAAREFRREQDALEAQILRQDETLVEMGIRIELLEQSPVRGGPVRNAYGPAAASTTGMSGGDDLLPALRQLAATTDNDALKTA